MSQKTPLNRLKTGAAWVAFVHGIVPVLVIFAAFVFLGLGAQLGVSERTLPGYGFFDWYGRPFGGQPLLILGLSPAI